MEGLFLFIFFIGLFALGFVIVGICELIYAIKNYKWKKWVISCFSAHPELRVLLSEYSRLRKEHCQSTKDALSLQKSIDEWTEQNKYLPRGHRVDGHIEVLKENYQELLTIKAEQWELVEKAKAELDTFWENNYPNLREDKRLMWLDEKVKKWLD